MQSTRRQEYSTALYAFAEAFPEMLHLNALVALQTLIRIMDHQRPEENDPLKQAFSILMAYKRDLLRLIDVIGSDLYFASGASSNSNEPEKSLEEKNRFWLEVEPLLDILDTIPVRNVTHHLLQMLEFLAPANPSSIFLRMGHMVLNGKESGYQYESFAVDLIVRAVERYLAEFRQVFREDGECLQTLISILDIFVDVGWPSARRLAYQIDVIFQ